MKVLTLLAWMELDQVKAEAEAEKEQAQLWVDHTSRMLAAKSTVNLDDSSKREFSKSLKEFEEVIKPQTKEEKKKKRDTQQVAKSFEWNSELMDQLLKSQGGV